MRHAYMILAHTGLQELRSLIHALDYAENDIFVHIDAKAQYGYEQLEDIKTSMSAGLFFITPQIDTTWGGSSLVLAHLALLKQHTQIQMGDIVIIIRFQAWIFQSRVIIISCIISKNMMVRTL